MQETGESMLIHGPGFEDAGLDISHNIGEKNACFYFKFKMKHISYGCVLVWALRNGLRDGDTHAGSLLTLLLEPGLHGSQGGRDNREQIATPTWPVL